VAVPRATRLRLGPSLTLLPFTVIMANIGGDVQRNRLRPSPSTPVSTPPSSPPPLPSTSTSRVAPHSNPLSPLLTQEKPTSPTSTHLAPTQSLELRIRWLEALLYGSKHDESLAGLREPKAELKRGETLVRAAEHAQRRMNDIANTYDVLRKFFSHCEPFLSSALLSNSTNDNPDELHAQYLTPTFALSGTLPTISPPEYAHMPPAELAALATEFEPDIRAADNDMREIDALQQKGVTGAGKLSGGPVAAFPLGGMLGLTPHSCGRLRRTTTTTQRTSTTSRRGP
jgi:hypothetical protein